MLPFFAANAVICGQLHRPDFFLFLFFIVSIQSPARGHYIICRKMDFIDSFYPVLRAGDIMSRSEIRTRIRVSIQSPVRGTLIHQKTHVLYGVSIQSPVRGSFKYVRFWAASACFYPVPRAGDITFANFENPDYRVSIQSPVRGTLYEKYFRSVFYIETTYYYNSYH